MNITIGDVLMRFIGGIKMLAIPRIEDMPYWSSPPIQFVYEQTANLVLGTYTFATAGNAPQPLAISRPIIENTIYYMRNITLSADIGRDDFLGAIVTTPNFQLYKQSENNVQLYRESIRMSDYFQQFDFRLAWQTQRSVDQLLGTIVGQLTQTVALIGKSSITIKAIISAQEIVDQKFTRLFRDKSYPEGIDA
jgi:hypothetical protein